MDPRLQSLLSKQKNAPSLSPHPTEPAQSRRRISDRLARFIPWVILLGFIAIFLGLLGDRLLPGPPVIVERVLTKQSSAETEMEIPGANLPRTTTPSDPYSAPLLFQASGWFEPDPYPIRVAALVDGFVDRVEVLEGARVASGQTLARLVDTDRQLNLRTARASLGERREDAAIATLAVQSAQATVNTLEQRQETARARLAELEDEAQRLNATGPRNVAERDISLANLRVATQKSEIETSARLIAEAHILVQVRKQEQARAQSRLQATEIDVERSALALERTHITSPIDGIVQRLLVAPGQRKMMAMDMPEASTVAILFDPEHMQARIDVPLDEAARVREGQAVRIRSQFLPETVFQGRVTRIIGEADLQRNTLQVKVAILNPHPELRPDMLCRAEFLPSLATSAPSPALPFPGETIRRDTPPVNASGTRPSAVEVWVPQAALIAGDAPSSGLVWLLDPVENRVYRKQLRHGMPLPNGYLPAIEGLLPGALVVTNPPESLREGQRVRPKLPASTNIE